MTADDRLLDHEALAAAGQLALDWDPEPCGDPPEGYSRRRGRRIPITDLPDITTYRRT